MTSTPRNPYLGHTLEEPRPTADCTPWRDLSAEELVMAQGQWDRAEHSRQALAAAAAHAALLLEFETSEEPATKALENRLRVAYLAGKGATMQTWIRDRDAIMTAARRARADET